MRTASTRLSPRSDRGQGLAARRPGAWLRRPVAHLALIAAGLLLGLVALEIALQVGSLFVRGRGEAGWTESERPLRLLFLGDSNTYGIYVDPSEAYPRVLEARWNGRAGAAKIEALNLGFPGTNSSKLRRDMPRLLRVLRPDAVIVMIGANDLARLPQILRVSR